MPQLFPTRLMLVQVLFFKRSHRYGGKYLGFFSTEKIPNKSARYSLLQMLNISKCLHSFIFDYYRSKANAKKFSTITSFLTTVSNDDVILTSHSSFATVFAMCFAFQSISAMEDTPDNLRQEEVSHNTLSRCELKDGLKLTKFVDPSKLAGHR